MLPYCDWGLYSLSCFFSLVIFLVRFPVSSSRLYYSVFFSCRVNFSIPTSKNLFCIHLRFDDSTVFVIEKFSLYFLFLSFSHTGNWHRQKYFHVPMSLFLRAAANSCFQYWCICQLFSQLIIWFMKHFLEFEIMSSNVSFYPTNCPNPKGIPVTIM